MWNYKPKKIYYLLFPFLLYNPIFSQHYNIKQLSSEEGLIQSQINSIVQDKNGSLFICSDGSGIVTYNGKSFSNFVFSDTNIKSDNITKNFKDSKNDIWFCSPEGLIKYDGLKIKLFTQQDGLADNYVYSIYEDKKGIYWIGSKTGLTKYDGKFIRIGEINNEKLISDVRFVTGDYAGKLWITDGSIIQRIDDKSVKTYKIGIPSPRNVIKQIYSDSKKKLWVATVEGLYYYENDSFRRFTLNKILSDNSILKIFESDDGQLWFSVRDFGLVRYNGSQFTVINETNGLNTNLIFEIYQDREKNFWFGTNEGLSLFTNDAFIKYDKASGLPENLVWSMIEDNKKDIWVLTDKFGISILSNDKFRSFDKQSIIKAEQFYDIYQDKNGIYWIASRVGLFKYDGINLSKIYVNKDLENSGVSIICGDNKNNTWFCTFEAGIFKYDGKTYTQYTTKEGLAAGEVYYAFDDGKGNIWITTSTGISIFDGKKFTNFLYKESAVQKEIFSLKQDKRGGIWGAGYGHGLYKITLTKNSSLDVKRISVKDGLISDNVYLIEIDDYDRMWVGTQVGLCTFSLKDYYEKNIITIKKYNKEDGIPHAEYNQSASYKDSKGFIWFGTNKGLIKCDPSKIVTNKIEPTTIIKDIKIFYREEDLSKYGQIDEKSSLPKDLNLPYDMNHITFEFIGISLTNSSKVQYKYILENFDREWHQVTEKNSETYSNLPSGSYTFKVIASNDDGIWNKEPISYSFTIATPYFRTWWFIGLSLIAVISISWYAYRLRMRKIESLNEELKKTLSERIVTEKKLLQSENDYRGLFENAHDAILVIDPIKYLILAANKEACQMYDYPLEELVGLSFSKIASDFEAAKINILDTLKTTGWGDYEVKHITKDGAIIDISANANVINYKGSAAIVALLRNITERKVIERALIQAKEEAEKSNLLKSNFLAQMSHEIRTPVNTILSYTSLLKTETQGIVSDELKESFQIIENGGRRLIRTIDSILNMSQILSGNQEIFPGKINLNDDVLLKLYNEFKRTAAGKSLEFSITNKTSNDLIMGDQYSLAQLFSNLIDNAIKYTPAGKVAIELENKDADSVTVNIKDTGIGMSEEFIPKLFQPFSQEQMGYTRLFEGNGLGLALVKSYCNLNNGKIEVESRKGSGTAFIVTFALIKE